MEEEKKESIARYEEELSEVIKGYQAEAWSAVVACLVAAMDDVRNAIKEKQGSGTELLYDRNICGINKGVLKKVAKAEDTKAVEQIITDLFGQTYFNNMEEVKPESLSLMQDFMGEDILKRKTFQARYPKAFRKWSTEDDEELLRLYSEMSTQEHSKKWLELAQHFGRNVNGVKLRLAKLGIDLGPESGRARF